jgi:hypothetical protein
MRAILPAGLLLTALLAGCASSGTGTLDVQATDAPDNLGDFSSLTVTVSSIDVQGEGGSHSYAPSHPSFDLAKLANGNTTSLFRDAVAAGNYTRIEFQVSGATGVLKADGSSIAVKAPGGTIFLNQRFTVGGGQVTTFVFDLHVVKKGNGDYSLQPNASGSRSDR